MDINVAVTLKDNSHWSHCEIHLEASQRLSDMMNDDRKFIPIKRLDIGPEGRTIIVNKDAIEMIYETVDKSK